jgi:probable addiction module antidote protein
LFDHFVDLTDVVYLLQSPGDGNAGTANKNLSSILACPEMTWLSSYAAATSQRRTAISGMPSFIGRNTKRNSDVPTTDYKETLLKDLKNAEYAAGYLTAAFEEGEDVFLLAVRDVARALGGIGALSQSTRLNRESLYTMLSKQGNPRLSSIASILDKLGFEVKFSPKHRRSTAA